MYWFPLKNGTFPKLGITFGSQCWQWSLIWKMSHSLALTNHNLPTIEVTMHCYHNLDLLSFPSNNMQLKSRRIQTWPNYNSFNRQAKKRKSSYLECNKWGEHACGVGCENWGAKTRLGFINLDYIYNMDQHLWWLFPTKQWHGKWHGAYMALGGWCGTYVASSIWHGNYVAWGSWTHIHVPNEDTYIPNEKTCVPNEGTWLSEVFCWHSNIHFLEHDNPN